MSRANSRNAQGHAPGLAPRAVDNRLPIAVIGAGYSGTMAAIHLARETSSDRRILLCERGGEFGVGLAYSTPAPDHLLNVRASNMSAFAQDPSHFEAWLETHAAAVADQTHLTETGVFASRGIYGRYLKSVLADALDQQKTTGRIELLNAAVVDCERAGDGFVLVNAAGRRREVAAVVLATGHVPPLPAPDRRYVASPWAPGATKGLRGDAPVVILGTALTMVDVVMSLRQNGFEGPIIALSRRGLLPRAHGASGPWPTPALAPAEHRSVRRMTRRLRAEVAEAAKRGVDWRGVVDSLRPVTQALWRGWSDAERARFLRHARRWWDVHRHRMAPPNAAALEAELTGGRLRIVAGRIGSIRFEPDAVRIGYAPLGEARPVELSAQRVIVATGLESAANTCDPFMRRLIDRGLTRWDRLGFGIDVTEDLAVVGADGQVTRNLWALGPILRGVFWECIAVPDIRQQAETVARQAARAPTGVEDLSGLDAL